MDTYKAGCMARFDAFGTDCQIRVRVLRVITPGVGTHHGDGKVLARVLDTMFGWRKGEEIEIATFATVPCSKVRRTRYGTKILTNYEWVAS